MISISFLLHDIIQYNQKLGMQHMLTQILHLFDRHLRKFDLVGQYYLQLLFLNKLNKNLHDKKKSSHGRRATLGTNTVEQSPSFMPRSMHERNEREFGFVKWT